MNGMIHSSIEDLKTGFLFNIVLISHIKKHAITNISFTINPNVAGTKCVKTGFTMNRKIIVRKNNLCGEINKNVMMNKQEIKRKAGMGPTIRLAK
jgi:hypothetical protein